MPNLEPLEFDADIEVDDYAAAAISLLASKRLRRRYWRDFFVRFAIVAVVLCLTSWWPYRYEVSPIEFLSNIDLSPSLTFFVVCAGIIFFYVGDRRAAYAVLYRRILDGRPAPRVRFRVDARGVAFSRDGFEGQFDWRAFETWSEQPQRHLLRYGGLEQLVIPTAGLTPSQAEALRQWIATRVGAAGTAPLAVR